MKSSNMFPHCLIFIKHLVTGWTSELIVNLKQNTIGILKELVTCPHPLSCNLARLFINLSLLAASDV